MVAKALNRPSMTRPAMDDDVPQTGAKEQIIQQLRPLLKWLKNRWVITALFAVAYVPFAYMYYNAYTDHSDLQAQIDQQQAVLSLPEPKTDDIEAGFNSWTVALESAKAQQVTEIPASNLLELLLDAATSAGVTITSASTSENVRVPVGEELYHATPVILQVSGDVTNLRNFIAAIEGDAIEAMEVESSLISNVETGYSAALRVLMFNRPVTPEELAAEDGETNQAPTGRVSQEELDRAAGGGK